MRGVDAGMTNEDAKAVLLAMGCEFSPGYLDRKHPNLVMAGMKDEYTMSAILDGDFTAERLEAIACWMRDPKGVAGA